MRRQKQRHGTEAIVLAGMLLLAFALVDSHVNSAAATGARAEEQVEWVDDEEEMPEDGQDCDQLGKKVCRRICDTEYCGWALVGDIFHRIYLGTNFCLHCKSFPIIVGNDTTYHLRWQEEWGAPPQYSCTWGGGCTMSPSGEGEGEGEGSFARLSEEHFLQGEGG